MADVRLDQQAINNLLRSRSGPVVQDLIQLGNKVQTRAKNNLRGSGASGLRAFKNGILRNSIATELRSENGNPVMYVGTKTFYGLWIHEGTRRMRARPYLQEALSVIRNR
jgi:hypothetical protein